MRRSRARTARNAAAIAAAAGLLACAGTAEAPAAPQDARNFAFSVMEVRDSALRGHDLDAAAGAYAENAEVVDAASGLVILRGRADVRRAHERFLAACPDLRLDVLDRAFADGGRIVADLLRVRCRGGPPMESRIRYEIDRGTIVRVLQDGCPLFPAIPGRLP